MNDPVYATCKKTYYPAYHNSGTRSLTDIKWIVLHDEESTTARDAAVYFRDPASGGSSHLCVDAKECYRCLDDEVVPWGAASSFGANEHGFHIEQAGFASWTPWRWKQNIGIVNRAAYKTAFHCNLFKIPPVWRPAKDLLAGFKGITTHAQVSAASKLQDPTHWFDYTHYDPGVNWPRVYFMFKTRQYLKGMV